MEGWVEVVGGAALGEGDGVGVVFGEGVGGAGAGGEVEDGEGSGCCEALGLIGIASEGDGVGRAAVTLVRMWVDSKKYGEDGKYRGSKATRSYSPPVMLLSCQLAHLSPSSEAKLTCAE